MTNNYPLDRSVELLKLLGEYGTVSVSTLAWMTGRNARRVRESLDVLHKRQLITKLTVTVGGFPAMYVQLSQTSKAKTALAAFLRCQPGDLVQRGFPITQLQHEDMCARLHFRIAKAYPEFRIVRDWQMNQGKVPETILPKSFVYDRLIPDLAIAVPATTYDTAWSKDGFRWIAVELERTRKKNDRVREKLNLYARETAFDGLLFILPEWIMVENFRDYFDESVATHVPRIRDFKDAFFARTILGEQDQDPGLMRLLCGRREVSFATWTKLIASTTSLTRGAAWRELPADEAGDSRFNREIHN